MKALPGFSGISLVEFAAGMISGILASLQTFKSDDELKGLVYALTPRQSGLVRW